MDLNKAMIIGRLTRDPEMRTTPQGTQVASFSIATNSSWGNDKGERQDKVEYHNIVAWQKLAEICGQYLKKGSKVYVEGRIQTRAWDAQDGSKKSRTEIVAREMIMLDSKGGFGGGVAGESESGAPAQAPAFKKPVESKEPATVGAAAGKGAAQEEIESINIEDIPF